MDAAAEWGDANGAAAAAASSTRKQSMADGAAAPGGRELQRRYSDYGVEGENAPLRERMWKTFEDPQYSKVAFYYSQVQLSVILLSTLSFCLETELNCEPFPSHTADYVPHKHFVGLNNTVLSAENCQAWLATWLYIEWVSIIAFTCELIIRAIICPSKRNFVWSGNAWWNWIDLLAILPFYLGFAAGDWVSAFAVFRVVRLVRVFRVFKMGKSSQGMQLMFSTLKESSKVLGTLIFLILLATVLFSSAIYYAEAVGENAEDFASIPRIFWFIMVTMTTVGYGDVSPVTGIGKVCAVLTMFCGIIILALPITVIGTNFANQYEQQRFERMAERACCVDGARRLQGDVDLGKLLKYMRDLEKTGNLKIPCPTDTDALQKLLAAHDGNKVGRIDQGEWKAFLKANVVTPSASQEATLKKIAIAVDDLGRVVADLAATQRTLADTVARQQADIARLLPAAKAAGGGGELTA